MYFQKDKDNLCEFIWRLTTDFKPKTQSLESWMLQSTITFPHTQYMSLAVTKVSTMSSSKKEKKQTKFKAVTVYLKMILLKQNKTNPTTPTQWVDDFKFG